MMATPVDDEAPDFLEPAMRELARGTTWAEFSEWFADAYAGSLLPGAAARTPTPAAAADEARRAAKAFAREIWRRTPDPEHGWRVRSAPQPGRNDPCFCGSGRKYKQCCQMTAAQLPPLGIEPAHMAALLFNAGPPAWRAPEALRSMPADMLAAAALGWREAHGDAAVVELLEPLFAAPKGLGDAQEEAFDVLQDALQATGQDHRRELLARSVAEHAAGRGLRCGARCRLAAMRSDAGAHAEAWEQFRLAQRDDAGNAQLLHLELMLLLGQGRDAEARQRAPLLAARARKLGYPELAGMLLTLGHEGMAGLGHADHLTTDEERDWIALLREPLAQLDAAHFAALHRIECDGEGESAELEITLTPQARRGLKPWETRFSATAPMLVQLHADADELLDQSRDARDWLRAHPDSVAAITVLDDLLIAAQQMLDESDAPPVARAAADLAFQAADTIVEVLAPWPQARLSWLVLQNRPVLRVMSQAIDLALNLDDPRAEDWIRWMLARNPHDNHGWREQLRELLLARGEGAGALALLDAYPDDAPPSEHERSLALYLLGRTEEAAAVLRAAHEAYPAFVEALLPDSLDRPAARDDGLVTIGSADHAWEWRERVRRTWVASGALQWLRGLDLRSARARKKAPPAKRAKPVKQKQPPAAPDATEDLSADVGVNLPWLLGWLAGSAWAPALVMPSLWAPQALQRVQGEAGAAQMAAVTNAIFHHYNQLNQRRLDARAGSPVSLPEVISAEDDAAWIAFAAGFVQMAEEHARGAWRKAGVTVSSCDPLFGPLYRLAARAPAQPGGWRAATETSQPLLGLVGEEPGARELLARALQPLWERTLAAS